MSPEPSTKVSREARDRNHPYSSPLPRELPTPPETPTRGDRLSNQSKQDGSPTTKGKQKAVLEISSDSDQDQDALRALRKELQSRNREQGRMKKELTLLRELHGTATKAKEIEKCKVELESYNAYMDRKKTMCTCPLCLELFTSPRLLDCGHSFCARCLSRVRREVRLSPTYDGKPVRCPDPNCRKDIVFGPTFNRVLDDVVEKFAAEQQLHRESAEEWYFYWPRIHPFVKERFEGWLNGDDDEGGDPFGPRPWDVALEGPRVE